MKSILLSIRPEWVIKILNGDKIIEIRKMFPKDFVGWVYIYVTKDERKKLVSFNHPITNKTAYVTCTPKEYLGHLKTTILNGRVVARFWCDNVEGIYWQQDTRNPFVTDEYDLVTSSLGSWSLESESCLTEYEMIDYLDKDCDSDKEYVGYAINISKLEIFDKPKELNEFVSYNVWNTKNNVKLLDHIENNRLTKAPQNYCYVEEFVNGK